MSDLARVLPWSQDEAELVTELQGGSGAAFDWLVTHYSGPVYGLVAGMVSESSDAADITQDVFLKAFRGIRGFRRGSSLKTWLYRIAIREALNHRRWLWRHHREQDSIDMEAENGHASLEIEDAGSTPFDQAASHEVQQAVQQALAQSAGSFSKRRDLEGPRRNVLRGSGRSPDGNGGHGEIANFARAANVAGNPGSNASESARRACSRRHAPQKRESVLHSTLFSAAEEHETSRTDTTGWAHPGKTGDAEGGV